MSPARVTASAAWEDVSTGTTPTVRFAAQFGTISDGSGGDRRSTVYAVIAPRCAFRTDRRVIDGLHPPGESGRPMSRITLEAAEDPSADSTRRGAPGPGAATQT